MSTEGAEQQGMTFQSSGFADFQAGDTIRFWTNDNGYGGVGEIVRTGTVVKVTEKTLTIDCESNRLGRRAVIRRADWSHRCPLKGVPDAAASSG